MVKNPKKISERYRQNSGIKVAKNLLSSFVIENRAIAVIGVKFGGWGISLEIVATNINKKINLVFPNFKFLYNYLVLFFLIHSLCFYLCPATQ